MTRFLAVAAVACGLTAGQADDKAGKAELDRFTGTWLGVSSVTDGKEASKDEAAAMRLVVAGEKYTFTAGGQTVEGTHKLDPTKRPAHIDAVRMKGPGAGEKMLGVYQLSEDSFVVSFAAPGKERPAKIEAKGGPGLRVLGFKREKKG